MSADSGNAPQADPPREVLDLWSSLKRMERRDEGMWVGRTRLPEGVERRLAKCQEAVLGISDFSNLLRADEDGRELQEDGVVEYPRPLSGYWRNRLHRTNDLLLEYVGDQFEEILRFFSRPLETTKPPEGGL
jgi:hypothetical protein